jgi:hypothetical protein
MDQGVHLSIAMVVSSAIIAGGLVYHGSIGRYQMAIDSSTNSVNLFRIDTISGKVHNLEQCGDKQLCWATTLIRD